MERPGVSYKLLLHSWRFVFKQVPNSHDYYFDIVSDNYQVVQTVSSPEFFGYHTKIVDTKLVRYLFEERKRAEIENIIRRNMDFKEPTPGKTPTTKAGPGTPTTFSKITPGGQSIYFDLNTPGRTHISTPKQSVHGGAFYQSRGIQRTAKRHEVDPNWTIFDILTIPELQDVPHFVPLVKELLIVRCKPLFLRKKKELLGDKFNMEEEEKKVTFGDISGGIKDGLIDWKDLEFSRECVNFIQRNIHVLDNHAN